MVRRSNLSATASDPIRIHRTLGYISLEMPVFIGRQHYTPLHGCPTYTPAIFTPLERHRRTMKVWIDQDLCTGDGLCEEIAPDVFTLLDDGLAYVKEGDKVFSNPGGAEGLAVVPAGQEEATIESAEECPGECIFIEID
jgi:ferredoxin